MRAIAIYTCLLVAACEPTIGDDPLAPSDEDDPTYEATLEWHPDADLDSDEMACDAGFEDCDALVDLDVEDDTADAPAGVLAAVRRTWPNGIIPYVIDDSVDAATRRNLSKAMTNWTMQTENRIRFRARRSGDSEYVRITRGSMPLVRPFTGFRADSVSTMMLRDAEYITVIKHELGHVIGFAHEHKRDERRSYINVSSGNIVNTSLCQYQFAVSSSTERPVPYDRVSVMHYRTTDLSGCRTGPVLRKLDGSPINHVWKLSRKDLDAVAKLYDAGGSCRAETTAQLCTRKGKECGALTARDNCGLSRTVNCGVCTGAELTAWLDSLEENGTISAKGMCTTVADASTIDGTPITSTVCRDGDEQDWRITRQRQLKIKHSLSCAAVAGNAVAGASIVQRACADEAESQKFNYSKMEIVNARSGECLTIPGGNYASGQQVEIATCAGAAKQQFGYRPDTEEIKAGALCLTPKGGANPGNPVVLASCDGRTSQHWFQARGGFVNRADTSQCMRVDGGALTSGRIEVSDCDDLTGQRWALRGAIRDSRQNLCVTTSATPGTPMQLAACDGTAHQQWTFWSR